MNVLVFGSRNLTVRHLDTMVLYLERVAAQAPAAERLLLMHGAGPPGKDAGAIGADKLSEVAAHLAWKGRERAVRRYPVQPEEGEEWGKAARRRDITMAKSHPHLALCFHTEESLGRGSAITAQALRAEGKGYTVVLMDTTGKVVSEKVVGK